MKRVVIAGRVFLNRKDAEGYIKKLPSVIHCTIEESPGGHYLARVIDHGDVEWAYRNCVDNGVKAFIWKMP